MASRQKARLEFTDQNGARLYMDAASKRDAQFAYCLDCEGWIGGSNEERTVVDGGTDLYGEPVVAVVYGKSRSPQPTAWPLDRSVAAHRRDRPDHKITFWVVGGKVEEKP